MLKCISLVIYLCRSRKECNSGTGVPPIYVNVNMWSGEPVNNWMDSLQAAWPGVQVINTGASRDVGLLCRPNSS